MTTKRVKISKLPTTTNVNKYYKYHSEGYGFQNGDFAFSDDINKWMVSKVSARRKHKCLFWLFIQGHADKNEEGCYCGGASGYFYMTKICKKCGQELPLTAFNTSVSKYIVGGEVKAIHESVRNICKSCQHVKGWRDQYTKKIILI